MPITKQTRLYLILIGAAVIAGISFVIFIFNRGALPSAGPAQEEASPSPVLTQAQESTTKPSQEQLQSQELDKLPKTSIFYDKNYLAYLYGDPQTLRQNLYLQQIEDGKLGAKKIVASFIRPPQDYKLILGIDQQKIALIDNAGGQSTLYIVDLKENSRTNLFSYPVIKDLKWQPNGDFLFEAREKGSITESVFLYNALSKEITKLDQSTL